MFCKIVAPSADIHKLADVPKSFQDLKDVVLRKFKHEIPNKFVLKYKDSEEELITLCNDEDLLTAVQTSLSEQIKTLRIFVILDNKPDLNADKKPEQKQGAAPSQESNNQKEKTQNQSPALAKKDQFAPEAYASGLEYLQGDSGKAFGENSDVRRIYEQLPQMLDLRRSVSHNPQLDFERAGINMNNPRSYDTNELMEKVAFRMNSPAVPDQVIMSEYFNDGQIKAIIGLVEQKVREKVEEKLHNISGDLMNKFQDDSRVFARGNNAFAPKAMGTPFGSRMFSRRNTNQIDDTQEKNCTVCGGQIDGIRYNCLNCKNFECCEKCETNVEHPHPLLKIRPSKGIDGIKQDASTLMDDQMPPILEFGSRASSRTMFQRTSSMAENSSQALVSEPAKANESMLKRSQVVSTPGQNVGIKRTGTPGTNQTPNNPYNIYEFGMSGKQQQNTVTYAPPYTHTPNNNNSQSVTQPTPQSNKTEKGEFKQYKVALIKPPLYEVTTVKAGMPYNISFTIKNNGDTEWPFDTKLICVEGNHKGEEIPLPALRPLQNYMVDLHLDAPSDYGRYFNEWKVHYSQNNALKAFGKEIMIEIEVIQGDKTEKVKKERHDKDKFQSAGSAGDKSSLGEEDQRLMKEYNCTEQVLKHAKVIQDLMCSGTLKEKVDFMKECSKEWDLNQIVSAYLTWINNPNKLKNMNNQNASQSTPSTE